jgi:metal-responsive CopG/Arc/MetJ family transcriptional regulator
MTETLNIRVPDRLVEALDRATVEQMTSRSEYVRQAVLDRLRRDGVDPIDWAKSHANEVERKQVA